MSNYSYILHFRFMPFLYPHITVSYIIAHSIQYYLLTYLYKYFRHPARFEKPIIEVGKWVFIFIVVQWVIGFIITYKGGGFIGN